MGGEQGAGDGGVSEMFDSDYKPKGWSSLGKCSPSREVEAP